jgi:NAD(P)-dependent dehydrogenase (short-subunit alcohol dehydrogenase family)
MASPNWSLQGKTVLITGAARGIGAETARRLHAAGANVALAGLEPEELEQRVAELGDRAAWFEADVTSLEAMEDVVAQTVERFGGIDVVVANAGIAANGTVSSMDPAAFERTIDVNLLGVYRTVRAALPHVVGRRGYVLIVSSASALVHTPMMAAYTASKAGVEAFGDALRMEVAHTGTKVGVAYFSFIDTDMVRQSFDRPSVKHAREQSPGAFNQVAPLSEAIDAIERGIGRRARHIVAPKSVRPLIWLRSLVQPLVELQVKRAGTLPETIRLAEQEETEITTPQPTRAPAP